MNSIIRKTNKPALVFVAVLIAACFLPDHLYADMTFLLTDKNDPNKAVVEIVNNKPHITFVLMKDGKFTSEKIPVEDYCKKEIGIAVTNIQGIDLKTDTKLSRCVTTENILVFIVRYNDGSIKVLSDENGNYNIEERLKDKNKKVTGIQYTNAEETQDGRLKLIK